MEESIENKNEGKKESRKRIETTGDMREKKRKKQRNSNTREKVFYYREFRHITYNCRNVENKGKERLILMPSNKFEVLKSKVMNVGEGSRRKIEKNRKMILREERLKKPVKV